MQTKNRALSVSLALAALLSPGCQDDSARDATAAGTDADGGANDAEGTEPGSSPDESEGTDSTGTPPGEEPPGGEPGDADSSSSSEGGSETTDGPSEPPPDAAATVFLNFDGVELVESASDDATTNTTQFGFLAGSWSGIDPARAASIKSGVEELLAPFSIYVTDSRPEAGPYTMVVVTLDSPDPLPPGTGGISDRDCGNTTPSNIGLVFDSPSGPIREVVNNIGFTLGGTYGLNQVEGLGADNEIMNSFSGSRPRFFNEACISQSDPDGCAPMTDTCASGEQSSFEEMLARFGPA